MRALTPSDFIALWEMGRALHPIDRGVLAVQAAFPELKDSIADWPIGRRNRALAELRCASFGAALRGWTLCRQCAEKLQFEMDGRSLAQASVPDHQARVTAAGHCFRLPTSRDLAAVVNEADPSEAARRLVQQCCAEEPAPSVAWSEEEIEAIGRGMAAADPLAEIVVSFDCPACKAYFEHQLDLASFLWEEVTARAKRALNEVHTLASAYGWSQHDILALTPVRREFYVGLVSA